MVQCFGCLLLLGVFYFHWAATATAVIKAITPLKVFLEDSTVILLAKIDKFYPEKPALVLNVQEGS